MSFQLSATAFELHIAGDNLNLENRCFVLIRGFLFLRLFFPFFFPLFYRRLRSFIQFLTGEFGFKWHSERLVVLRQIVAKSLIDAPAHIGNTLIAIEELLLGWCGDESQLD